MPKIYLSNGLVFDSANGQTILDAARQNDIAIEHSCRNGRCGVCVAPLLKGETDAVIAEEFLGNDKGKAERATQGIDILTCCRTAISDIHLDIEDLGIIGRLPLLTLPCRIDNIKKLNEDVLRIILRLPQGSGFMFCAGQYIDLIHSGIRRSYSIANSPRIDGKLELQIKKIQGGVMSDYLFEQAAQHDLLRLEGPLGTFSFREDESENIILLATGTGIAPIKALLEYFSQAGIAKNIYVIWGARRHSDLYLDTTETGASHTFIPVLSREKREGVFFGYVQHAALELGLDMKNTTVYACGSEAMIRDASTLLVKNGLMSSRFYSDAFLSSK